MSFYNVTRQQCGRNVHDVITGRVTKVMFSQASLILSHLGGKVTPNASWDRSHGQGGGCSCPGGWTSPHQMLPPSPRNHPPEVTPHHHHIRELRLMGRRYASYCNAFLFLFLHSFTHHRCRPAEVPRGTGRSERHPGIHRRAKVSHF